MRTPIVAAVFGSLLSLAPAQEKYEFADEAKLTAFVDKVTADRLNLFANLGKLTSPSPQSSQWTRVETEKGGGRFTYGRVRVALHAQEGPNAAHVTHMIKAYMRYRGVLQKHLEGWEFHKGRVPVGELKPQDFIGGWYGMFTRTEGDTKTTITIQTEPTTRKVRGKRVSFSLVSLKLRASYPSNGLRGLIKKAVASMPKGNRFVRAYHNFGVPDAPLGRVKRIGGKTTLNQRPRDLLELVYGSKLGSRTLRLELEVQVSRFKTEKKVVTWTRPQYSSTARAVRKPATGRWVTQSKKRQAPYETFHEPTVQALFADWIAQAGDEFAAIRKQPVQEHGRYAVPKNFLHPGEGTKWQRVEKIGSFWRLQACVQRHEGPSLGRKTLKSWLPTGFTEYFGDTVSVYRPWAIQHRTAIVRVFKQTVRINRPNRKRGQSKTMLEERTWIEVVALGRFDPNGKPKPLTGDCQNGYGTAFDPRTFSTYEGYFKNGVFHGPGRLVSESNGRIHAGTFFEGKRHGPAVILPMTGGVHVKRARYENDKEVEAVTVQSYRPIRQKGMSLDGYETAPWIAGRGEVLSGNPKNGYCRVRFKGLGVVAGTFENGMAEGQVTVYTDSGERKLFNCAYGIPALVRCVISKSKSRSRLWHRRPKEIPIGDCLEGNSHNGKATIVFGEQQTYEGWCRNGKAHGKGLMWDRKNDLYYRGEFVNGLPHGWHHLSTFGGANQLEFVKFEMGKQVGTAPIKRVTHIKKPKSNYVQLPDIVMVCSGCRGMGTRFTKTRKVAEVVTRPFMPGDRHYGSWLWSGYAKRTGRTITVGGDLVRCGGCNGTGSIRRKGGRVPRSWLKRR